MTVMGIRKHLCGISLLEPKEELSNEGREGSAFTKNLGKKSILSCN